SIGPTGELFMPMGMLDHRQAFEAFCEQATALADGGADVLWIETMSSTEEVAAATEAAKTTGLPVCATLSFDTARCSMMGVTPMDFAQFAVDIELDMLGSNCGIGPAELLDSTQGIVASGIALPVVAKGNCGIPQYMDGAIHFHGSPDLMAQYALFARDVGATIIGGCCGTTPEHVAAMVTALATTAPRPFDAHAMNDALGIPWANLPTQDEQSANSETTGRRRRSQRREH
ncbi:homocysteine S-methyltransferase family protein, partial [Luminiphilus sp.]